MMYRIEFSGDDALLSAEEFHHRFISPVAAYEKKVRDRDGQGVPQGMTIEVVRAFPPKEKA